MVEPLVYYGAGLGRELVLSRVPAWPLDMTVMSPRPGYLSRASSSPHNDASPGLCLAHGRPSELFNSPSFPTSPEKAHYPRPLGLPHPGISNVLLEKQDSRPHHNCPNSNFLSSLRIYYTSPSDRHPQAQAHTHPPTHTQSLSTSVLPT